MKNTIIITIDTERDQHIIIAKPSEITPPANAAEAKIMILTDIDHMVDTLLTMINVASSNKYANKKELIEETILKLHATITENPEIKPTQLDYNDTKK